MPPLAFIDTHAHLNHQDYGQDRAECLARAREAGCIGIINVGYDLKSSWAAMALVQPESDCFAAVGIHPHDASSVEPSTLAQIGQWSRLRKVVAIGEIGLDYFHDYSPHEVQRQVFRDQLAMARELCRPIIVHCRDAERETLEILRRDGVPEAGGVMHCFPGGPDMVEVCVELGLYVGVNGIVTFRNADLLREAVRATPEDRLLVETDCPYLAPMPARGKRNEPALIPSILAKIAEVVREPVERVAEVTTANARRLFGLPE
jgi:TatD DNase family protein